MKVKVSYKGQEGYVQYNEDTKDIQVVFPNDTIGSEIDTYLNTKRIYRIPESQKIDDFREELAYPSDGMMYFELAMCELWANTDVYVHW